MMDLLTHNGVLGVSDYLVLIFATIATIGLQILQVSQQHGNDFKFKILIHENYIRWMVSLSSALFLLYILPDAYFWYMESYTKQNAPDTTEWNTMLSAIVGLSPLYILKRLIKVSRSKFRNISNEK